MKRCPSCKSKNIAHYVYGLPASDKWKEIKKEVDAGKIKLGGCMIGPSGWDPKWKCNDCGRIGGNMIYDDYFKAMKKCPHCQSKNIAEYVYEPVMMDKKMKKKLDDGKIIIQSGDPPSEPRRKFKCNDCPLVWNPEDYGVDSRNKISIH